MKVLKRKVKVNRKRKKRKKKEIDGVTKLKEALTKNGMTKEETQEKEREGKKVKR